MRNRPGGEGFQALRGPIARRFRRRLQTSRIDRPPHRHYLYERSAAYETGDARGWIDAFGRAEAIKGNDNATIKLATGVGDNGTHDLLQSILNGEENHVDWIQVQLDQIKQLGIKIASSDKRGDAYEAARLASIGSLTHVRG